MTDPHTILAAAGVSLPEVDEYREATSEYNREADRRVLNYGVSGAFFVMDHADAAILALAREVAKLSNTIEAIIEADHIGAFIDESVEMWIARYAEEVQDGR